MARTTITNEQMVINLIGEWTPTNNPQLFKSGFSYVADLIPRDSELWSSANLRSTTNLSVAHNLDIQVFKIIKVIRTEASIERECVEIPYKDFVRGESENSIFYNRKNTNSPVWTWMPDGKIAVSPPSGFGSTEDPKILVYFWVYEYNDFFGTSDSGSVFDAADITSDIFGFPREAHLLAIIRVAQNILQVKIGAAVHEEEDIELLQLMQGQMGILDKWFQEEAQRLRLPYKIVGVEEK